jgi:hypothetical protein
MKCSCIETLDSKGTPYPVVPEWHNCKYIEDRNKLIPIAEEYALANSKTLSGEIDPYRFTQLLSNKMDQLSHENNLV